MRVRLEPRKGNREAEEMFRYHLHRDGYVHVTERLDRWYVFHPNANTGFCNPIASSKANSPVEG